MEIVFLGTSSGTPTKSRNVSGIAVKMAGSKRWCLVDCGEGTQHQILHTSLTLKNLQAVFITHLHGDHCYGLPGLLASAATQGRTEPLMIVCPVAVKDFVLATQQTTQLTLSYPINFVAVEGVDGTVPTEEFDVEVTALSHRVPSFAYSFIEKKIYRKLDIDKLKTADITPGPAWGEIQRGNDVLLPDGRDVCGKDYLLPARSPRKIIIAGDNDTPSLLKQSAETADVLVHEATYTEDIAAKVGNEPQHSTAKQVAEFATESAIAGLILTHFSCRYQGKGDNNCVGWRLPAKKQSINAIASEARQFYKGNLFLANDLDVFHLSREGELTIVKE